MNFATPTWLWTLLLLLPLVALLIWSCRTKQRLILQFVSPRLFAADDSGKAGRLQDGQHRPRQDLLTGSDELDLSPFFSRSLLPL